MDAFLDGLIANDIHSRLNETSIRRVMEPEKREDLSRIIDAARKAGAKLSICGGRHAMGGQQFGEETWLVDMRRHSAIRAFDIQHGLITACAGIQWRELIEGYLAIQNSSGTSAAAWGIRQKQTGADSLTLGGALAANIHGRGLRMPPIISDVEAFSLVNAQGEILHCSRMENADLFRLAIGGYGMFGIIEEVTLRLMQRRKVERRVEIITLEELVRVPEERDTTEWLFGDFQFSIDENSPDFLQRGVFSAYHRIDDDLPVPAGQQELRGEDWTRLLYLAHTDRRRVFDEYAGYYLSTHGQRYWSDTHQLTTYVDDYHAQLDCHLGAPCRGSEMITEIYVPRDTLAAFMGNAAEWLRCQRVPVIYGTIRLIERDTESFLAWAREPWACIIFNLHVEHTEPGIALAQKAFRGLIDLAVQFGGSYYLTYHRWASREQVEACHPRFREFLRLKQEHDPGELFTSDWYRHHKCLFAARPD